MIVYVIYFVAITGGGNNAIDDALYLSDICKKVYLIYRGWMLNEFQYERLYHNLLEKNYL